jgi:hypothetical protein
MNCGQLKPSFHSVDEGDPVGRFAVKFNHLDCSARDDRELGLKRLGCSRLAFA